jgi:hypothetical protein
MLGLLTASYSLSALLALHFVRLVFDHFGRRGFVPLGSLVMIVEALIQWSAVNSTFDLSWLNWRLSAMDLTVLNNYDMVLSTNASW